MIQAMLYASKKLHDVVNIESTLDEFQAEHPHELHIIDIDRDHSLQKAYGDKAPVLDIGLYRLEKSFNREEIKQAFVKAEEKLQSAWE